MPKPRDADAISHKSLSFFLSSSRCSRRLSTRIHSSATGHSSSSQGKWRNDHFRQPALRSHNSAICNTANPPHTGERIPNAQAHINSHPRKSLLSRRLPDPLGSIGSCGFVFGVADLRLDDAYLLTAFSFRKTLDRIATGSMNEVVTTAQTFLAHDTRSPDDVNFHRNDTLRSRAVCDFSDLYATPRNVIKRVNGQP